MASLTGIPGTPSSPAREISLGLQRLAEACPEFAHTNLLEKLSENRTANTTKSGLKLSWPKASNTRRAVVAKMPPTANVPPRKGGAQSISVPVLEVPWNPRLLETGEQDMFEYFQSVALRSLPTFGQDQVQLGQMLLRAAGAGDGTSFGVAVQQSLLAFSSTHRHGVHTRAAEHKIAALKALADISGCDIGPVEAVQHVAAGMLLCSYEDIIRVTALDNFHHDPDVVMLLDWVYYYSVLACWSRQHWHRKEFAGVQIAPMRLHREASSLATTRLAYIELLSEMCDGGVTPLPPSASSKEQAEHKSYLQILDWRIRNLSVISGCDDFGADSEAKVEVYRLAMLVYLNRASENALNQTASKTLQQLDRGFSLLAGLEFCDHQFPVFILGCEASNDGERETILGLIQRTEEHGTSRSFNYASRLLEAFWAQNDLGGFDRRGLTYRDRISDVISSCMAAVVPLNRKPVDTQRALGVSQDAASRNEIRSAVPE
ncbi:hypothetical protein PG991_016168 [Apiospora marii]|uniref:Uncharacterized protein n=1 Tax=Apiospora marii TaxID=335849 RepID=A0ABR1R0V6_9PEZI